MATSVGAVSGRLAQCRIRAALDRPVRVSRSAGSAPTMTALSWLIAWVRDLTAEAAGQAEHAQHLHRPVAGLGRAVRAPGQDGVGGGDGVDGVGLAVAAAGGAVGAVDLDHGDAVAAQVSGQGRAVGAGALHPGTVQHAEATGPGQQLPVAGAGGGELGAGQQDAQDGDDRGDVDVLVGVDTEDDLLAVAVRRDCSASWCGMLGMGVRLLIGSGGGWPSPGRPGGQNCDGALVAARPLSGHALPVRRQLVLPEPTVDRSDAKASTEPVALRVRPRSGENGSTIPEPQTQTHSCVRRIVDRAGSAGEALNSPASRRRCRGRRSLVSGFRPR